MNIALPIELSLLFFVSYESDFSMEIPLKGDTDLCPPLRHDLLRHHPLPFVALSLSLVFHNVSANSLVGRKAHHLRQGVRRHEGVYDTSCDLIQKPKHLESSYIVRCGHVKFACVNV